MTTSGVLYRLHMEDVGRSWWGPSARRTNFLLCVTQKLQADEKDATDVSTKRPVDEGAASLNANEVLMLHSRLKIIQERVAQANKTALEVEKARDEFHN